MLLVMASPGLSFLQERKREAVVTEHQRRIQEAMATKRSAPDEMELKAMKAMGAMEEGDAVFGAGAEVNLDSQVPYQFLSLSFILVCYFLLFSHELKKWKWFVGIPAENSRCFSMNAQI